MKISEREHKACKEFDSFRKLFFRDLEKTQKRQRKAQSNHSVFHVVDSSKFSDLPQERKRGTGSRNHIHIPEDAGEDTVRRYAYEVQENCNEDAGSMEDQEFEKHKDCSNGVFKKSYEKHKTGNHARKTS